jgi:hypothetical protein
VKDENSKQDEKQGKAGISLCGIYGNQQKGSHSQRPEYPGGRVYFYDGDFLRKHLPQGKEKERYVNKGVDDTDNGGRRVKPHGHEYDDTSDQKLPGKGIKNIE